MIIKKISKKPKSPTEKSSAKNVGDDWWKGESIKYA